MKYGWGWGVSKRSGWMGVETQITQWLEAGQAACRFSFGPMTLDSLTEGTALGSWF